MPLNWQYPEVISKRANFVTEIKPNTYVVCMTLMCLGFREINKSPALINHDERVAELARRVNAWEAVHGIILSNESKESITLAVLLQHWGIDTNVSQITPAKFDRLLRKQAKEKAARAKWASEFEKQAAAADERQDRNRQSLGQRLGGLWKGKFEA
jgi:transketolase